MKTTAVYELNLEGTSNTETTNLPSFDNCLSYLSYCLMCEAGADPRHAMESESNRFDLRYEELAEFVDRKMRDRKPLSPANDRDDDVDQDPPSGTPTPTTLCDFSVHNEDDCSIEDPQFERVPDRQSESMFEYESTINRDTLSRLVQRSRRRFLMGATRKNRGSLNNFAIAPSPRARICRLREQGTSTFTFIEKLKYQLLALCKPYSSWLRFVSL